jgi:hypothetical protein
MRFILIVAIIVVYLDVCRAFGSVLSHNCRSIILTSSLQYKTRIQTQTNLYRKFHDYGWDKLLVDSGISDIDTVPEELQRNTSPAKGAPEGTNVVVNVHSVSQFPFLEKSDDNNNQVLRLARSAFLETQSSTNEALINPMTIHVLNFVLFPTPHIQDSSSGHYLGLPIFGADIVSLPGNKHLVALDFQPVLPISNDDEKKATTPLIPHRYSQFEDKLQKIHAKYQKSNSDSVEPLLAWGGDIPEQAERFFSPYALWTRLVDDDAIDTVNKVVWEAFQEYTDLYLELMTAVQSDVNAGKLEVVEGKEEDNPVWDGQLEYLEYRRTNDPARPMLQRLYGNQWSESVIGDVLFPEL